MPAPHSPTAIRPPIGKMNRESPGCSIRAVTAIYPPPGIVTGCAAGIVTGRVTGGDAPRWFSGLLWPAVVDGLQHRVGVGAAIVGPLDRLGPEGAGADGARHEV